MEIEQRQLGDAIVIDLAGSMVEGEHCQTILKRLNAGLAGGVRKFVLNVENVSYINSTGLGGLVQSYVTVSRAGGLLCLCHPRGSLLKALTNTRLLSVFMMFESASEAVEALGKVRVESTCPRCGPNSRMRLVETDDYQRCPVCAMQFKTKYVVPFPGKPLASSVTAFRLPTYDGEFVDVLVGTPSILTINGRLDLFASETVEQAISLLPRPREVVCKLGSHDVSSSGLAALVRVCRNGGDESRVAISLAGQSIDGTPEIELQDSCVLAQDDRAIQAVHSGKTSPPLTVMLERVDP